MWGLQLWRKMNVEVQCAEMYMSGINPIYISAHLNLDLTKVYEGIANYAYTSNYKNKLLPRAVIDKYKSVNSVSEVAEYFSTTAFAVKRVLKAYDLEINQSRENNKVVLDKLEKSKITLEEAGRYLDWPPGLSGRPIWLDYNRSSPVDSEEKAFWLGVLWTLGDLSQDFRYYKLPIYEKHRDLYSDLVEFYEIHNFWVEEDNFCRYAIIGHPWFCSDLVKSGFLPGQTYDDPVNLEKQYYPAFIDGAKSTPNNKEYLKRKLIK